MVYCRSHAAPKEMHEVLISSASYATSTRWQNACAPATTCRPPLPEPPFVLSSYSPYICFLVATCSSFLSVLHTAPFLFPPFSPCAWRARWWTTTRTSTHASSKQVVAEHMDKIQTLLADAHTRATSTRHPCSPLTRCGGGLRSCSACTWVEQMESREQLHISCRRTLMRARARRSPTCVPTVCDLKRKHLDALPGGRAAEIPRPPGQLARAGASEPIPVDCRCVLSFWPDRRERICALPLTACPCDGMHCFPIHS